MFLYSDRTGHLHVRIIKERIEFSRTFYINMEMDLDLNESVTNASYKQFRAV